MTPRRWLSARRGYGVVVADAGGPPGEGKDDSRAFFIAYGCWRIFKALGLEEKLLASAEPVTQVDAEGRIGGISFIAEDCAETVLGYMIEAGALAAVLHEAGAGRSKRCWWPDAGGVKLLSTTAISTRSRAVVLQDPAPC